MNLADMMNQQYEEVDSKNDQPEQQIDKKEVLKYNELTKKWLDDQKQYEEDRLEAESFSKNSFSKRSAESRADKKEKEKRSTYYRDKDEKEEKKSYSYYSSYSSSSSKNSKSAEERFYDKIEADFEYKIQTKTDKILNRLTNRFDEECQWDILDWQYAMNRKRIEDRYTQDSKEVKEFNANAKKLVNSIERKMSIAEIMLVLKICPFED